MSQENDLNLPPLNQADLSFDQNDMSVARSGPVPVKTAEDLEQVFDVPVTVSAVLGSSKVAVGDLLQIVPGTVLGLDRRVGEAIEQLDLALGRQGGVIGHVVAGADEVVEGQDRAPVAGMDQVRGDGEILVPVALAGARRGGGIEGAHAR